jgi:hypothetical protein
LELLKKCTTESSKYVGIGATIFFTGLFAALSGAYALYTVFDSIVASVVFGLVWGLMIFNLDRYIVSSMRKERNSWREFRTALPRIVLAILISIVIARPLEMKIFDKEIQSELIIMEQQTYTLQESEIKMRFQADQQKLRDEIASLKSEIEAKTAKRDELDRIAQEEADGTGGTRKRNAGPIYKIKKADADRYPEQVDELLRELRADPDLYFRRLCVTSSGDSIYYRIPILASIDPSVFVDLVLQQSPSRQRVIMMAFKGRYEHGQLKGELAAEAPWLLGVRDKLVSAATSMSQLGKYRVERFVHPGRREPPDLLEHRARRDGFRVAQRAA